MQNGAILMEFAKCRIFQIWSYHVTIMYMYYTVPVSYKV